MMMAMGLCRVFYCFFEWSPALTALQNSRFRKAQLAAVKALETGH